MNKKTFSVSEILMFYFNIYPKNPVLPVSQKKYIGLFIHKILNLYYKYNKDFNIVYFLNSNEKIFNEEEKNKIIFIIEKLKKNLIEKKWKILYHETNFFYNNLFGKPDAIYIFNDEFYLSRFSSLLIKYFYNIKSNCVNKNIFLNNIEKKIYDKEKKNIILIDWKCSNRDIFFCNYSFSNYYLKNFFYNTLYNKFLIQMNIYKYILEKNKFKVMEMYICLLNIDNSSIKFIPIYFLKQDFIENLINNFYKQKI